MLSAQMRKSFTYFFPKNTSSLLREPVFAHHFVCTSTQKEGKQNDSTNSESVALFLKELGLSDTQLDKVFKKNTQLHSAKVEKSIRPKIRAFHDFGFSNREIVEIVAREPSILCTSASNRLIPTLSFLNDLLGSSHDDLFKVAKRFGWFLAGDMKKHVLPNIELLNSYGVPIERIVCLMRLHPTVLYASHETFRSRIDKLETLGMHPSSKMFIYAFWVFGSLNPELLDQKMRALRDLGFSETQILAMSKKLPLIFTRSAQTLKDITEMLLSTKKYSRTSIVTYPMTLTCSIDKRLKPRLDVLKLLEKMSLLKEWPRLGVVSSYDGKRFDERFVVPYRNQLEESYAAQKESLITAAS